MQKKPKLIIFIVLFSLSLILNLYFVISDYIKSTYTLNSNDQEILAEMTKMVLESEEYKKIASKETVYAIKQNVNRFNVADPSSIFHYGVYVQTEKESYIFSCIDKNCTDVSNGGMTYSRYSDEKPILPLNRNN